MTPCSLTAEATDVKSVKFSTHGEPLLPCPFCGSDADTLEVPCSDGRRSISVFCGEVDDCGAEIEEVLGDGATYSMAQLVRRWNQRVASAADSVGRGSNAATASSKQNP